MTVNSDGPIDYRSIVEKAAAIIRRDHRMRVTAGAVNVLIDRAKAHDSDARRSIREQKLTEDDLVKSAVAQFLEGARPRPSSRIARLAVFTERTPVVIDTQVVEAGMRLKCHWVPWC